MEPHSYSSLNRELPETTIKLEDQSRRSFAMTRHLAWPLLALGLVGIASLAWSQQAMLEPPDNHYFVNQDHGARIIRINGR